MSKKFLLSQTASAKVAVGLATIGGIGAISYDVINQMTDVPIELEENISNQNFVEAKPVSEVLLPTKMSSVLDNPIKPENDNDFNPNKKIELESLTLENSTRTENEVIPFETEIKYNNEKPSNYTNLIQEGVNGSHTVTFIDSFDENGKLIQSVKTLEEHEDPIKQIIEIGTNENIEQTEESNSNIVLDYKTTTETIPKDTIYSIDENLSKDESYTVKGEDGTKEVTTNIVSVNGVETHTETIKEEIINPAINDVTYISEEEYNKKVNAENLKEIELKDSNVDEKIIKKERNSTPKNIDFETIVTQDESLPEGQIIVEQLGVAGSEYDVYQDVFVNDNLISSTILRTVTTPPISQIERHGTKKEETKGPGPNEEIRETLQEDKKGIPGAESIQKIVKETKSKDLKTEVIYDETIPEGTEEIVEEGQAELYEITYKITSVNDEIISKEKINEEIITQAVNRVVKIGTGKTTKSYDTIVTEIPFETETINDDSLFPDESYIKQKGQNGSKITNYEITYMNGNIASKEIISTNNTKEPVNEIKIVGTKAHENIASNDYPTGAVKTNGLVDLSKTRDIALKQGLKEGDKLTNGVTVNHFAITDDTPLSKIVTLSEQERYQKADKDYYNLMVSDYKGQYLTSGIPLSQGSVDYINEHLDRNLLAMYMEQKINELRTSLGKAPLKYKAELQKGTQERADEQSKIGSLRSNGKAHTRPDGTEFRTAFKYLNNSNFKNQENKLGENIAQFSALNQYLLTSEKKIAETLFNQWSKSPGHYANMISDNYKYFAFAVSVGRTTENMREYSELYPSVIGVQIFQIN